MEQHFEFDVALSFAGEQRNDVESVANCLRYSGVRVFYDEYEKATLWGRDLYQHLSDVYKNKARYCIVFVSADYVRKTWTNHELRSAQARAFEEKGQAYILPVRFDQTEIPGILATTGYLSYQAEGPEGICSAITQKLRLQEINSDSLSIKTASLGSATSTYSCDFSPRALINPANLDWTLYPNVIQANWSEEIELHFAAEDSSDEAAISQLRTYTGQVVVGYGFDVAIGTLKSAKRSSSGRKSTWILLIEPRQTDFADSFEHGVGTISADEFAARRARRLLLDEFPAPELGNVEPVATFNNAIMENSLLGLRSLAKIKQSIFPILYKELETSPDKFLEFGWISAVTNLKLSAAVETIERLHLSLEDKTLTVDFSGRRKKKYINVDPYRIEISGKLQFGS